MHYTYPGSFRAKRFDILLEIDIQYTTWGGMVEMQLKAATLKMKITEVPGIFGNGLVFQNQRHVERYGVGRI